MRKTRKVLFLVENAPIPGDPRVWNEAVTLRDAGYRVCIIAPKSVVHRVQEAYSCIDGIPVYRFKLLVTTQDPGSQATGNGEPAKTAERAGSMDRPCLRMVET
jgi:hypothetical protein